MKDNSNKSLAQYENVDVKSLGRQVNVRKATLRQKLYLLRVFTGWMSQAGSAISGNGKGGSIDLSDMEFMSKNLPAMLESMEKELVPVIVTATGMDEKEADQITDIEDITKLLQAIWKVNKFQEDIAKMGKANAGPLGKTKTGSSS